ncbi:MAG: hypothetical protein RIC19_05985 [Phaeodactylibacter sp.]
MQLNNYIKNPSHPNLNCAWVNGMHLEAKGTYVVQVLVLMVLN